MVLILSVVCALLAGFVAGWAAHALAAERRRRAETDTLGAVLQQLAAQELERGTQRWLQLSDEKDKLLKEQLSNHAQQLSQMLTPLADQIKVLEQQRQEAYGRLDNALKNVVEASNKLREETTQLSKALSQPQARGRWGELTLRRVVELAGMTAHVDFDEQVSITGEGERGRPDMVVHLPNGRTIVVDAKVPLDAYLQACEQIDDARRAEWLSQHARKVRDMVNLLSSKDYCSKLPGAPDFVVLFVPGDQFLSAALMQDEGLLEFALGKRVVLATPSTLLALLRVVAEGWRAAEIHANVERIKNMGVELYNRFNTLLGYMRDIADGLAKAIKAYNSTVSSLNSRLVPMLKEFGKLQGDDGTRVPQMTAVDTPLDTPRALEDK